MNRRLMAGVAAVLLVTAGMIAVGVGAYRAGERNAADGEVVEVVGEVLTDGESGERTILVDRDGWRRGRGFFPGFVVFPLIAGGLVLLAGSRHRRGPGHRRSDEELDEWHRKAHADESRSRLLPDR